MQTRSLLRTMHTFLVYAPYKIDEGSVARRLSVRPQHIDDAKARYAEGLIQLGGPMLTPESLIEGAVQQPTGSMLIIKAANMAGATKMIKDDIYYTAGVWDPEKLVISPIILANLKSD